MRSLINRSGAPPAGKQRLAGLFISLKNDITNTLKEIYDSLHSTMQANGYTPNQQNVSINVRVGGHDVDLVPAKHQGGAKEDRSLYRRRADTWTQTNVIKHISTVENGGRAAELRVLKLWRDQKGLDLPSFYLEMTAINALSGKWGARSDNVWTVLQYLRDRFPNARVVDPANTNNIISDDLSAGSALQNSRSNIGEKMNRSQGQIVQSDRGAENSDRNRLI